MPLVELITTRCFIYIGNGNNNETSQKKKKNTNIRFSKIDNKTSE